MLFTEPINERAEENVKGASKVSDSIALSGHHTNAIWNTVELKSVGSARKIASKTLDSSTILVKACIVYTYYMVDNTRIDT